MITNRLDPMSQNISNKTVLLFEDDDTQAQAYIIILEGSGYNVVHNHNTKDIKSLIKTHTPVIVITDLVMADYDGIEGIFKITHESAIPIIAISAYRKYLDLIKSEVSMALSKPVTPDTLLDAVQQLT